MRRCDNSDAAKLRRSICRLAKFIELKAPASLIREEARLLRLLVGKVYGPWQGSDPAAMAALWKAVAEPRY